MSPAEQKMSVTVDGMESPVRNLVRHVPAAVVNIAPEKISRIRELTRGVSLCITEDGRWICETLPSLRIIRISRAVLEWFWCQAYAYVPIYQEVARNSGASEIDLRTWPATERGTRLLRWTFENWVNQEHCPWPEGLPRPVNDPPLGSMENVADELCLVAIAVFLHHELAHCDQDQSLSSVDREIDADRRAVDLILDDISKNDPRFVKRALGIVLGFGGLVGFGIQYGDPGTGTHPSHFARLVAALDRHIASDENHIAWAFAHVIIKLHLDARNLAVPKAEYSSFRECVLAYARQADSPGCVLPLNQAPPDTDE